MIWEKVWAKLNNHLLFTLINHGESGKSVHLSKGLSQKRNSDFVAVSNSIRQYSLIDHREYLCSSELNAGN